MRNRGISTRLILGCALAVGCSGAQETDPACPALPAGVSGTPSTIADAITMANALTAAAPQGMLSIDCVIKRLDRPLTVLPVASTFSLQPAVGTRSPRIFIFTGGLVMSIVPAGTGSPFLEMAEYTTPLRSIKAQATFPLSAPIAPAFPYDDIRLGAGTTCGACHTGETPASQVTITEAFESDVFRPTPAQLVRLSDLASQAASCDAQQEPDRCAMLSAVFDHGDVVAGAFPPDAPLFGQ